MVYYRQDYYFRPNGCIAIAVAPDLFTRERAIKYLHTVETVLIVNLRYVI